VKKKYQNRRNISYQQAQRYYELMQGNASEICLKCFGRDLKGQAVITGLRHRQVSRLSERIEVFLPPMHSRSATAAILTTKTWPLPATSPSSARASRNVCFHTSRPSARLSA